MKAAVYGDGCARRKIKIAFCDGDDGSTDVFWLALLFSGLMGFVFIVLNVSNQTLIQSAVDPAFRGRVISIYGMVLQGMPALGALAMGTIAEHIGLRIPVFMGGVICMAAWYWAWRRRAALKSSLETEPVGGGG